MRDELSSEEALLPCQAALTRAADSPIGLAGRRQRANPAQTQARGKRSPGKDQHVQPANYLPPPPPPAPNTNSLVLTLPEIAAVSMLSGRTSLSKCEPGCESGPVGTALLSPRPGSPAAGSYSQEVGLAFLVSQ